MKVLSLFDGISCARVALERAGIPVEAYYASEIDKYAIQISQKNYPDIKLVGDVQHIMYKPLISLHSEGIITDEIDLLIGGSPCQDLSIAKKNRQGLSGERSGLFWEYVRILNEVKPKYFILENVNSMPKEAKDLITKTLGVEPIMIDAALVSAQRRKRLFWTNIPNITQPEDRELFLKDIITDGVVDREKSHCIDANYHKGTSEKHYKEKGARQIVYQYRRTYWRETIGGKVPTLTANMGTGGHNVPFIQQTARGFNKGGKKFDKVPTLTKNAWEQNHKLNNIRKLTPVECERLQSLPDNYTEGVSNTQRYKALGNAFNVDVVAHILSFIPKQ